jgi:NTP pyrophosphatase (non-canonical NTP hydrolase)
VSIFEKIAAERTRQDAKWGEQNHADPKWLAILVEEVGEVAKAMLEHNEAQGELVQCAAVLVAWLECRDRRQIGGAS